MSSKTLNIIGIGEVLWDVFPEGKKLGGAPCNFVYHAQKQGAKGLVLSAVGSDKNGEKIFELLHSKHISTELIQVNNKATSTVDITLNNQGIPEYTIHEDVAWDFIEYNDVIEEKVSKSDVIYFGSLAQRNLISRNTILKILIEHNPETIVVYDINLRQSFYNLRDIEASLQLCNILKLNEDELKIVCELTGINAKNEEQQVMKLLKRYNLKLLALTKGSEGSLLLNPSEKSYLPTPKVEVKDTVGAGDAFAATMIVNFTKGRSLKEIHKKAVEISAFVCTQDGAMPQYK